jgi:hypothetical protein
MYCPINYAIFNSGACNNFLSKFGPLFNTYARPAQQKISLGARQLNDLSPQFVKIPIGFEVLPYNLPQNSDAYGSISKLG